MKYEDFVHEVHEKVKDEEKLDREKFERKVEEVAAAIGRGARLSVERLDDWVEKTKKAWPEVERNLKELGESFVRTFRAFGEAFRRGFEEEAE